MVGSLNFVCECVRPSRVLMARMFNFLKGMPKRGDHQLSEEFKRDIYWWSKFMPMYNRVSLIPAPYCAEAGSVLVTDACPTGCGGFNYATREYFHTKFPDKLLAQEQHINVLELWAIMVAIMIWGTQLRGLIFRMKCDKHRSSCCSELGSFKEQGGSDSHEGNSLLECHIRN